MTATAMLLVPLVFVQLAWDAAVILRPYEVMYGEAIVYDHAARLVNGEPLYQHLAQPPNTVANYTPLYYWLAAAVRLAFGSGFLPGRVLSFVSALMATALIGYLTYRRTCEWKAGAFAGALFFVLGLPGIFAWSSIYKIDMLGVALGIASVALLSSATAAHEAVDETGRLSETDRSTSSAKAWRLAAAGALAGTAILTKQSLLAPAVAGMLWLIVRDVQIRRTWRVWRTWRNALLFGGTCLGVVIPVCGMVEWTTGAFVENTLSANVGIHPFRGEALLSNLVFLGVFQAGPLAVAAVYLSRQWLSSRRSAMLGTFDGLLTFYWLATLVPLLGLAHAGSNQNYWIEAAASTAIVATLAVWSALRLGSRPSGTETDLSTPLDTANALRMSPRTRLRALLVIAPIAATVLCTVPVAATAAPPWLTTLWPQPAVVASFQSLVDRVQTEPREVLADPLDIIPLSGRRNQLEPALYAILWAEGRWDATPLVRRICGGEIGLLVLGYPIEDGGPVLHGYTRWPVPVLAALRHTMSFEEARAGRYVYRYSPPAGSDSASCLEFSLRAR
jgi:hypothetical protein